MASADLDVLAWLVASQLRRPSSCATCSMRRVIEPGTAALAALAATGTS